MEIVDIIFDMLLYGSGLLVFAIAISFVFSKKKTEEGTVISYRGRSYKYQQPDIEKRINHEQRIMRRNQTHTLPQIFPLEQVKTKEIRVVRKSTVTKRDSQETLRFFPKHSTQGDGNGVRYTIVNEELKKENVKVGNFYF